MFGLPRPQSTELHVQPSDIGQGYNGPKTGNQGQGIEPLAHKKMLQGHGFEPRTHKKIMLQSQGLQR